MLLPTFRVAIDCRANGSLGRIGEGGRLQNWESAAGYQEDTKRLIAFFFKEQKELNNRCSLPSASFSANMVAFPKDTEFFIRDQL